MITKYHFSWSSCIKLLGMWLWIFSVSLKIIIICSMMSLIDALDVRSIGLLWEQNSIHLLQQRNAIRILIESVWMLSLCLTTLFSFYEEYDENLLTDEQKSLLRLENYKHPSERKILTNKCICLLSKWPFFDAFEKFLFFIYKRLLMGPFDIPLERYISHFLYR